MEGAAERRRCVLTVTVVTVWPRGRADAGLGRLAGLRCLGLQNSKVPGSGSLLVYNAPQYWYIQVSALRASDTRPHADGVLATGTSMHIRDTKPLAKQLSFYVYAHVGFISTCLHMLVYARVGFVSTCGACTCWPLALFLPACTCWPPRRCQRLPCDDEELRLNRRT